MSVANSKLASLLYEMAKGLRNDNNSYQGGTAQGNGGQRGRGRCNNNVGGPGRAQVNGGQRGRGCGQNNNEYGQGRAPVHGGQRGRGLPNEGGLGRKN